MVVKKYLPIFNIFNIPTQYLFIYFFSNIAPSPLEIVNQGVATTVPNTNKHSTEGSNPIWLKTYANEWFKNDDNLSNNGLSGGDNNCYVIDGSEIVFGPDSLDENCLASDNNNCFAISDENSKDIDNNLNKSFNVYHKIEKLNHNAQLLTKKLETTEL